MRRPQFAPKHYSVFPALHYRHVGFRKQGSWVRVMGAVLQALVLVPGISDQDAGLLGQGLEANYWALEYHTLILLFSKEPL